MVDNNLAYKFQEVEDKIDYTYLPEELKYTSVSIREVFSNRLRLEASAFNLEAKVARKKVENSKYGYINLWSNDGLIKNAYYPGRFRRIYVSKKEGKPFYLPSQLTEIKPKATKYISPKTYTTLEGVEIKAKNLLMTRSGTIGKCTISSKANIGKIYSDDVIRVSFNDEFDLGYTYSFFQTKDGQLILQTNNYGAVVQHIEPEHLESVIIPNAPSNIKKEIHELVVNSFKLRDQSNDLIDQAEQMLYEELKLKPIEELKTKYFDDSVNIRNFSTKLSELRLRLDGSFHVPIIKQVESYLKSNAKEIVKLSSKNLTNNIILPGRFSRTYVNAGNGVQFLGGRDLFQLNPTTEKYLSKIVHSKQLQGDLKISKNDILTPSRGTIGRVVLAPEHFSKKAISDNIINIKPANDDVAGYLFVFLNSDYGSTLIKRQIYGGVVDAMEPEMLESIEIPILKNEKKQKKINNLALEANELRYRAYLQEQESINKMQNIIDNTDIL